MLIRKSYKQSIFLSLIFHLVILISFGLSIYFFPNKSPVGETKSRSVPSYLYQQGLPPSSSLQTTVSSMTLPTKINHPLNQQRAIQIKSSSVALQQQKHSTEKSKKVPSSSAKPRVLSKGEPLPELIALLHAAIQREQHYPAGALEMEREGRVTVTFILFTNGNIDHLKMIRSSGTTSLDEAALAAVSQAAPFKGVDKLLKEAQEYQIDVVFELT